MKCLRSLFWTLSVWLVYGGGLLVVAVGGETERQERSDHSPPRENEEQFVSVTIEMDHGSSSSNNNNNNDDTRPSTHDGSVVSWGVIHFTLWAYNSIDRNDTNNFLPQQHDSDESLFVFQQTLSHICRTIHHEDDDRERTTNHIKRNNEKENDMIQPHDSTNKDRALFFLRHACVSVQQEQQQQPVIQRLDQIAAQVDMDMTFHLLLGSKIRSGDSGAHGITDATPIRYVAFPVRLLHPQNATIETNKYYRQSIVPSSVLLRDENKTEMKERRTNHTRMMGQWFSSVSSPFHLAIPAHHDNSPPLLTNQRRVHASIASSLSNLGGMHRPFHHKINLSVSNDNHHSWKKREATVIAMDILLPLSENVYIDMDDPYHDGGTSATACRPSIVPSSSVAAAGEDDGIFPTQPLHDWNMSCSIELSLPPSSSSSSIFETSVIDVEQPSFVSPQHVLLFRLKMTIDATTAAATAATTTKPWLLSDYQIEIQFSNTLHIRYPSPVVLECDSVSHPRGLLSTPQERRHVMVHIPKPIILAGTITNGGGGGDNNDDIGKKQKTEFMVVHPPKKSANSNILMLSVAAGADEDYWFVVTITLLSTLIGSIIMIRDISRVSIWI